MVKGTICILVSVCLFLPAATWLCSAIVLSPVEEARVKEPFVLPQFCMPEPGERAAYLAGVVSLPLMLFGFAYLGRRWDWHARGAVVSVAFWVAELVLAGLLLGGCWFAFAGDAFFHFRMNQFFIHPLRTLPVFAFVLASLWGNWQRGFAVKLGASLVGLGVLGVVCVTSLVGDHGNYASTLHFTAVFDPLVQVHLGKAVLIDSMSQYGLYPHFLEPLFALGGLSVLKFTALMGLLTALSYGLVGFFLSRVLANQVLALLGFLAAVFDSWLCFVLYKPDISPSFLDVYFQYQPIRLFFPACALVLAWLCLRDRRRGLYWGALVFLAGGVLWNMDSGVPAFVAWVSVLCFAELGEWGWRIGLRKTAGHLLAAGFTLVAVLLALSVAMRATYGAFPDYGSALRSLHLFYVAGFAMLPMPLPGAWMVVILIYLAGLTRAAFSLAAGKTTVQTQMGFFLSVLGIGLFTYFQGRSHPVVLTLAWWPCFPLLALFLDELVAGWKQGVRRPLPAVVVLLVLWFLTGSAWSLVNGGKFLELSVRTQLAAARWAGSPVDQEAHLLHQATPPGGKCLVVSQRAALIHLHAGVPSVARASLNQLLLVEDYVDLCKTLEREPRAPVFVDDPIPGDPVLSPAVNPGVKLLMETLGTKYRAVARTDHGCLYERVDPATQVMPATAGKAPGARPES